MSDKSKQMLFTVMAFIVIALYLAGMILMICGNAGNGITLWVFSTVIGALMLYVRRTQAKKKADLEAEEAEERERLEKEKNS